MGHLSFFPSTVPISCSSWYQVLSPSMVSHLLKTRSASWWAPHPFLQDSEQMQHFCLQTGQVWPCWLTCIFLFTFLHWVNGSLDYLAYTRAGSSLCTCRAWHAASSVERIVQLLGYPLLRSHHTFILPVPRYLSSVPWLLVLHESVWMIWAWQS